MIVKVFLSICAVLCLLAVLGQKQARERQMRGVTALAQNVVIRYGKVEKLATEQVAMKELLKKRFQGRKRILVAVALCESSFLHTNKGGEVRTGEVTPADTGVMQISLALHGEELKRLGLDPRRLEDNLSSAEYLFEKRGTRPWNATKSCWSTAQYA